MLTSVLPLPGRCFDICEHALNVEDPQAVPWGPLGLLPSRQSQPFGACCAGISRVKDPAKSYLNATNDTGTPMYMAPEQFNGTRVDEKARTPLAGCHRAFAWI